jgi:hypothetical protein
MASWLGWQWRRRSWRLANGWLAKWRNGQYWRINLSIHS